jgi:hypothetical protein
LGGLSGDITPTDVVFFDTADAVAVFVNKDAGLDKEVTVSGYQLSGADAFKYILSQPVGVTATIDSAQLSVVATKPYDGTATFTNEQLQASGAVVLSGVIPTDVVSLDTSGVADVVIGGTNAKDVGAGKPLSGLQLTGDDKDNYALVATATITPRYVTFDGSLWAAKEYDGTVKPPPVASLTLTNPTLFSNLVKGEDFTLDVSGVSALGEFPADAVAAYQNPEPTLTPYTGSFGLTALSPDVNAANYVLVQPTTITAQIYDCIELTVTTSAGGQQVALNKYFSNQHYVNWGDDNAITGDGVELAANTTHSYAAAGTYRIRLTSAVTRDGHKVWAFSSADNAPPLVSSLGTNAERVVVSFIPPMERFVTDSGAAADNFFRYFNKNGAIKSLPNGSFDTSRIAIAGNRFFASFNDHGALTSLPAGSFDISRIEEAGSYFFNTFNYYGALTSLPAGSFNTSGITIAGADFFSYFNSGGALASLPAGSFNTGNIITTGNYFFYSFNSDGHALKSLPPGSFDTSSITWVGIHFFAYFNSGGALTSLPDGSFQINSDIKTVSIGFFYYFNREGFLTSLPAGSFDASQIGTAGNSVFSHFNYNGALGSLPTSFKFPTLSTVTAESFSHAFDSATALAFDDERTVLDIIGGCVTPSEDRETFSSNQPGYGDLDDNWKGPQRP